MSHAIKDPLLLRIRESIRADVDSEFDFLSPGRPPWFAVPTPLRGMSVALVSTAGLHLKGDRPFRTDEAPLGDTSFRLVPAGTPPSSLDLASPHVDRRYVPRDPEVALPLRALAAIHRRGVCGPPAPRHASFSGGIVRPMPELEHSAEELAALLRADGVGAVILLPSCPLCVQTVCLLARWLERREFATVCVSLVPELSRIVGAPRTLTVRFPFGAPCGDPGHAALHEAVLSEALDLIDRAGEPGTLQESRLAWRRAPGA